MNIRSHLREILENSCVTMLWREEDEARTKFRLSVVLRLQSRPTESERLRKEALEWYGKSSANIDTTITRKYTDKDDMELFDKGVTLWHGRTTGPWSRGDMW